MPAAVLLTPLPPQVVVIAGPPAAGKGTQCMKVRSKYELVHFSVGDVLREQVARGTDLGLQAKMCMDRGALVPSALILDLVRERLEERDVQQQGCLLDGFPRTPAQAEAMEELGLRVNKFLLIEVPDDTLVERGCGRRLDPQTGEIYHLKFKPPPSKEILGRLVCRSDDQAEMIRKRLKAYHEELEGILPFFEGVVFRVDGTGSPEEVFALVSAALDGQQSR